MNLEQKLYEQIGIRKEHPKTNPLSLALMAISAEIYAKTSKLTIIGLPIPAEGPAIITGAHVGSSDAFKMIFAGRNFTRTADGQPVLGRQIIAAAKHTLLEPFSKERDDVLEETGKTDWLNSDRIWVKLLKAVTISPIMRTSGFYPIHRGEPDRSALAYFNDHLAQGGIVATALLSTRRPDGTLRNIKPGSAFLAINNPDVPIYFVAASKNPNLVNIGGGLSYNEISEINGRLRVRDLTLYFADQTAALAIPYVQEDWAQNRDSELKKLYKQS